MNSIDYGDEAPVVTHWSEWRPGPEHPCADVIIRKDALLYHMMVDRALDGADPAEWCWDKYGRGIWIAHSWFNVRGDRICRT